MSAVNELTLLRKWIYGMLAGDSVITTAIGKRVYSGVIPEGATPVPDGSGNPTALQGILYGRHAGNDNVGAFGQRMSVTQYYQIKAVCTGDSYSPCGALADSIERLFGAVSQSQYSTTMMIVSSTREDMVEYNNNDNGVRWNYVGGIYKIIAYYNGP